ncbi:hypothetical protein M2459_003465 [Parabacteroides sp. PF5-5]|uniref:DUF4907 domain-containing protein n=1 Tax=unclassified Parabacteroides TaxID=2649774 RepID=UPI00247328A4|nr:MULTISPECIES: DUF4907 domain-containing protein [unclassified Parabacteroides]MDH6306908.1 hypothetical protein [Parabacteroides sp. PH5-39]MDH6317704.1 hypothetical protein [Parabacteroides sp. PF5-13]MDH6321709.1 hypothetical protein [Parabacteroides sp. PH5-13]MDH6325295.1 hypothetical protein [Parabacteroides sp. PH5-8]MDH6328889.1 hypothetical protein [Parabacteroides sp. PH5-41]
MMNIKGKKIAVGLLLFLMLILSFTLHRGYMGNPGGRQPELQTFQSGDGWGYRIMFDTKVLVYQPTVPAIDTIMTFPTESSARQLGSLVLKRIKKGENFTVTYNEVKHSLSH